MMLRLHKCFPLCIAALLFCSCFHGPVRYKVLGYHRYATAELTARAPSLYKVPAFMAGLSDDLILAAADTVFTPIISLPIALGTLGPSPLGERNPLKAALGAMQLAVRIPLAYGATVFGMPWRNPYYYIYYFGAESSLLH